jgi:hypothetical protein
MGIKHFRDLSTKRKRAFFDDPSQFIYQEKLDGSQFIFGFEGDDLWTSRKTSKEKFFTPEEWPTQMWAQNFKLAHIALCGLNANPKFKESFVDQSEIHCELLASEFPNTLTYSDHISHIVAYNTAYFFSPLEVQVAAGVETSTDGLTTVVRNRTLMYRLSPLEHNTVDPLFVNEVRQLPDNEQYGYMVARMSSHSSAFGVNVQPEGHVFKHKDDGWMFKVVDELRFTETNTANYAFRRKLFRTPGQKTNSLMDTFTQRVKGGMLEREAAQLALIELGIIRSAYLGEDHPASFTHRRNCEALASIHQQLTEIIWAEKPSLT